MTLSAHAQEQGRSWGTDPQGWLEFGEPHNMRLFVAALDEADTRAGTRILDIGCGTGGTLVLAHQRGAIVSGIDVCEPLLEVARDRLPHCEIVLGEADCLPWADGVFDAAVGINSFQFAADPRTALSEAARVVRAGGRIVATLFAEPERSEATVIHHALNSLVVPSSQPSTHAPYALSDPGNLESAMIDAGLELLASGEVECTWEYPDYDALVRGILSSAGGARALAAVDRPTAAESISAAARPYQQSDGTIRMRNIFRWVSGENRPEGRTP